MVIVDEKLYDVIYLIESSIANGNHYEALKRDYLLPSIRYFNGGANPVETDWLGADNNGTQYCLLLFHNKLKFAFNVTNEGVTRNPYKFSSQLNTLKFTNGGLSDCSLLGEGLATALQTFDDLAKKRESSANVVKHCIVVGHLPPFTIPVFGSGPYAGFPFDKLLDTFNKKSINLSVISGRIVNQFKELIKKTSPNEFHNIISKSCQLQKDPKHMVFLKGFHIPDIGSMEVSPGKVTENSGKRGSNEPDQNAIKAKVKKIEEPAQTQTSKAQSSFPAQPFIQQAQASINQATKSPLRNNQTVPVQQPQQQQQQQQSQQGLFGSFTGQPALAKDMLSKMADKINKSNVSMTTGSQQFQQSQQGMMGQAGAKLLQPQQVQPQVLPTQQPQQLQQQAQPQQQPAQHVQPTPQQPAQADRKLAWTGQLQWQETTVSGNEPGKSVSRILPCHATIAASETLKTDVWPSTLQMQLIPQTYVNSLNRFLKPNKTVQFQFSPSDSLVLQAMYRVMNGGCAVGNPTGSGQKFAGCVILNPPSPPNPNHVHVLLLLYVARKKTFMGVIPEEQQTFVKELGAIITADKNRAKYQQNITVGQQVRPQALNQGPVNPIMNPQITSTNQQINTNQISAPQIIARQLSTNASQNSPLRNLLTTNPLQQQMQQQSSMPQQQPQVALQQQPQLQPQLQQQAAQQVPQVPQVPQQVPQVPQQVVNNSINWRNQLMLQHQQQQNQRVATAMAMAQQQQQQQQQQTQMSDPQMYGDFLNPVTMNSLQQ